MRRISLITPLVLILMIGSAFGVTRESTQKGLVAKGFKLGMNLAKFTGSDVNIGPIGPSYRVGLGIGGFLRFGFNPNVGLQLEALYSMKGSRYASGGESITFRYDYFEIPVLLLINISSNSSMTPNILFGPAVNFKISSKLSGGGATINVTGVKSTDLAIIFGFGITAQSGRGKLLFDVLYSMGLTKWIDDTPAEDLKNSVISLNAGYAF